MKSREGSAPSRKFPSRYLLEQAPEPLWLVRLSDMRIEDVNRAATDRFGFTREQFLQMTLSDFHPESDVKRLRAAAATGDAQSSELRGWKTRNSKGETIDTDLSVRFLPRARAIGAAGIAEPPAFALICALDMTSRKMLEERVRQAGKMEAIGMLAGGIAHDFNNLLTIISGYSQLLIHSVPESDRSSVEQILKASERAAELTGQLLAFSRRQEMQPQSLDINRIVSGMSTMLRRLIGEHIELKLSLSPGLGSIHADPSQIDQVIMNLVVNARDAMAQGGKLLIETSNIDLTEGQPNRPSTVRPGRYVLLTVNDTGVGMDPETRARVFDPFFTTKEKGQGTGLGLSTVFGIVKQAGGTVDLFSEREHGTSVKVFLPRAGDGSLTKRQRPAPPEVPGGRETILVVEDEEAVRRLVRATLERRGYYVLVASGGPEALEISRMPKNIDLLLTDLVMPQMSGVEVADRVRESRPGIRVLFMSGYTDRSLQRTETLPAGTEFLQKPFTPAVLAARVRELLDSKDGRSPRSLSTNF